MKRLVVGGIGAALLAGFLLASVEVPGHHRNARAGIPARLPDGTPSAVHKIRHVVLIMQENRSFDSYFGTYPGADGIPGLAGNPGKVPCVPDPKLHRCVRPYHDVADRNFGGPHNYRAGIADLAGGGMTGFIKSARTGLKNVCAKHLNNPACSLAPKNPDVMGYHDWREIPNYWDYAHHFVLQDHMFESDLSWSLPDHLSLVSGWSAKCRKNGDPMSCHSSANVPGPLPESPYQPGDGSDYAWTDLTYLLHRYGVSWGYYVANGSQPDCANGAMLCASVPQRTRTPGIWNPLPYFDTVRQDGQLGNMANQGLRRAQFRPRSTQAQEKRQCVDDRAVSARRSRSLSAVPKRCDCAAGTPTTARTERRRGSAGTASVATSSSSLASVAGVALRIGGSAASSRACSSSASPAGVAAGKAATAGTIIVVPHAVHVARLPASRSVA